LWQTQKQRGSTSPSKVYANSERTADFLLEGESIKSDSDSAEVGLELLGRPEDNPGHPQAAGRLRIGGNIVNIDGFCSPDFAGAKNFAIDNRIRFASADAVGIDAVGKETEEGEVRLRMGHVDGVGVGKQGEAVIPRKFLQEGFGMDRIGVQGKVPGVAELLESERGPKTLC